MRGSYYSGGRTNRGGRSNRGSTVFQYFGFGVILVDGTVCCSYTSEILYQETSMNDFFAHIDRKTMIKHDQAQKTLTVFIMEE